jgi:alpha-beta hydrolase superfamily lysophospholipase
MKWLLKALSRLILGLFLVLTSIVLFRAFDARSLPDLEAWHQISLPTDPLLADPPEDFSAYLEQEQTYLKDAYAQVQAAHPKAKNKYNPDHFTSPVRNQQNLNGSFALNPDQPVKGGILLLHGLTDSPYHLSSIGQLFQSQGYKVICLRLPGHGTIPAALKDIHWEDWAEAVAYGAERLQAEIGDLPFYMGGFSTGGALAVHYSLERALDQPEKMPEKVFLFAPAMGVSAFAEFADWHYVLSQIPYFEKFQWTDIEPEYDPYKYNSFPKNAGDQIFDLTQENEALMEKVNEAYPDRSELPAFYSFQSIADATVNPEALFDMYAAVGSEQSELILFDVNRLSPEFLQSTFAQLDVESITKREGWNSQLWLVQNLPHDSIKGRYLPQLTTWDTRDEVIALPGADTLRWPPYCFALSHVCIPMPPEDEVYGKNGWLGGLNVKGEKSVLTFSSDNLMRIRYNPFYSLVEKKIVRLLRNDKMP